jgi:aminoglycoside phosphotransferase (APT) family kinase protein
LNREVRSGVARLPRTIDDITSRDGCPMKENDATEETGSGLPDPRRVAEGIERDLRSSYGPSISVESGKSLGGGFDNVLVRMGISGTDVPNRWPRETVARVFPRADLALKASREAAVHRFCADTRFPATRVLASGAIDSYPYLLLEFVPAQQALLYIALPWTRKRAVNRLVELQAQLHNLPTNSWPAVAGARAIDRWLVEIGEAVERHPELALDESLLWLQANRERGECDNLRVCHLDFHPMNVLMRWRDGTSTVLDWDVAALADPCCDVGFTVEVFTVAAGAYDGPRGAIAGSIMRSAQRMYLPAYRRFGDLDAGRVKYWQALYCVLMQLWISGASVGDIETRSGAMERLSASLAKKTRSRFEYLTGA